LLVAGIVPTDLAFPGELKRYRYGGVILNPDDQSLPLWVVSQFLYESMSKILL
jgi:hypothetical protein